MIWKCVLTIGLIAVAALGVHLLESARQQQEAQLQIRTWVDPWVADLVFTQREGCHADSWSGGLYCHWTLGRGARIATRSY